MSASDYCPVTSEIIEELKSICGEAFVHFDDRKKLEKYSRDKVPEQHGHLPEVIVMPKTAQEIAGVVKLANREMIPITPRAAGSGLSGGAVPIYGGILLSVERMNDIIEVDDRNLMAVVEPGVVTNKLDEVLQKYGLFFAGYPMSEEFCFIGGNVAENAGGGKAVKYGVTISGEHGIGHKRRDYMGLVMSEAHLDMMRKIKRALDPKNILNPGKIFSLD